MNPSQSTEDPGFDVQIDSAELVFNGDQVIDEHDAVIRDATTLAQVAKLPTAGHVAVLADGSLVVLGKGAKGAEVHHIVGGRVQASYSTFGGLLLPTDKPNELWLVTWTTASRERFGEGKLAGMMVPVKSIDVPGNRDGRLPGFAALTDGAFAFATATAVYKVDAAGASSFAWSGSSIRHLGPGPDASSVWASNGLNKLDLVKLAGGKTQIVKSHSIDPNSIVHMASNGKHAAAVIAQGEGVGNVSYALVVFDDTKERWRVALGAQRQPYHVAVGPKRVIVRAGDKLQSWDLATGK